MNRWVIYQRERFPLAAHAPLVAAFSASAVCFSSLLRGHAVAPSPAALVVAFTTSLLFFLQLRIADEFKDCEDDARFRPYRPVPRGLVTLAGAGRDWRGSRCRSVGTRVVAARAPRVAAGAVVALSRLDDARVLCSTLAEGASDRLPGVTHADSAAHRSLRDGV